MNLSLCIKDLPIVFLSFREPNAELHYQQLESLGLKNLLHVHGVKGFDAAHKRASDWAKAHMPDSTNFVTIDADNQVTNEEFWEYQLSDFVDQIGVDPTISVISFRAVNHLNGACYGNGGIKLWSHTFAKNMQTHEQSNGKVVDFCWESNYIQVRNVVSRTHPNGDALQAFRSGYREGVKLLRAANDSLTSLQFRDIYDWSTVALHRWIMVGSHLPYGAWANLGTLVGIHDLYAIPDGVNELLIDYDRFEERFHQLVVAYGLSTTDEKLVKGSPLEIATLVLGEPLLKRKRILSLPLSATRSELIWNMTQHDFAMSKLERER